MAKHGHLVPSRFHLFFEELPAERRLKSQSVKEAGRYLQPRQCHGVPRPRQIEAAKAEGTELVKDRALLHPVEILRSGADEFSAGLLPLVRHINHALGVVKRQRAHQYGVRHGEYRRVRPDPDRQDHNHNSRKAGTPCEYPKAVSDILPERFHLLS